MKELADYQTWSNTDHGVAKAILVASIMTYKRLLFLIVERLFY